MIFAVTENRHIEIDEKQLRQLCERRLAPGDLTGMTRRELELLRNGIFAIHKRPFARSDLRKTSHRGTAVIQRTMRGGLPQSTRTMLPLF